MTVIEIVDTTTISRPEWLDLRRTGIGGSDAGTILGLNRWAAPLDLWLNKTGRSDDTDAGLPARVGTALEPLVRQLAAEETGETILEAPMMYRHPERPWQLANVDGLIGTDGIFEAKTTAANHADQWANNQVPPSYYCQVAHYLSVLDRDWALIACLIGNRELVTRRIERDAAFETQMLELEEAFWASVEADEPPQTSEPLTTAQLAAMWKPEPGLVAIVDADQVAQLIAAHNEAAAAEKTAKAAKETADAALKQLLGAATDAHDQNGNRLYTWRPQTRTTIDTKRLRTEHPDIAAEYATTSETRTLRITPTKDTTK